MSIINISGYKFIPLQNPTELRNILFAKCKGLDLRGTILLSEEGININLLGTSESIMGFKNFLAKHDLFFDIIFHETHPSFSIFKNLHVKIKKEIINFRKTNVYPEIKSAPSISPLELKKWLDETKDITLLDTRNKYEVCKGTFKGAKHLNIQNFIEFPNAIKTIDRNTPIVMFCTGGIRCEKAALYLLEEGFKEVYQLQRGILNYFKEVGNAHYEGDCFVFDQRVCLDPDLKEVEQHEKS